MISEVSHREPGAIVVDVIQTLMLDPAFPKKEYFKDSEEIMGNIECAKAIMVLIAVQ